MQRGGEGERVRRRGKHVGTHRRLVGRKRERLRRREGTKLRLENTGVSGVGAESDK